MQVMSVAVCLVANTISYPEGGGHFWVHLNWALGLRSCGCDVIWLEVLDERIAPERVEACVQSLKSRLAPYGLVQALAICTRNCDAPHEAARGCRGFDAAMEADLAINVLYTLPAKLIKRLRRSAFLDIDPGLLQLFVTQGLMPLEKHDLYFTIGETVGTPQAKFPDAGVRWQHTLPCVALDWWPVHVAAEGAPFTTVSHWYSGGWVKDADELYCNYKREGFLPFLDLPQRVRQPLELALCLGDDEKERAALEQRGWRVREAWEVAGSPEDYQRYIQGSRGEFSCVKPSCVRLQNAWISDRTLCYLASGKPALVQHTGPSKFLPDDEGLFRFRDLPQAVRGLETIADDYERQSRLARVLAEQLFDARKVVNRLLERSLA